MIVIALFAEKRYRQYIGNVIKAKYSTDFRRLLVLTERHSLASVTVSGEIGTLLLL
jgi:hypothetical protein